MLISVVINLNGLSSNKNLIISDKNTESGAIKSNNYLRFCRKLKINIGKLKQAKKRNETM